MSSSLLQILVLAAIAIFLVIRLRSVLGTRDGFEKPPVAPEPDRREGARPELEVIEGGVDSDIADYVPEGSPAATALAQMKAIEPGFSVREFIEGARAAYEMILMAFEHGDISEIRDLLSDEVAAAFQEVIDERRAQGLDVRAEFLGVREIRIVGAEFSPATALAEITVRFVSEMNFVIRDAEGNVVEGDPNHIRRQKDVWTFERRMGSSDPNWILVATGE